MSNVVNLNKARKVKDRQDARDQAKENRVKFGRAKSEKTSTKAEAGKARRALDGAKRET
ncbi:DUF4169 family protein [Phenylobacterium sp.]|uniref:DUF4169 family protein n=1 Tax=Phenylobacterium sp. TaxID=1871053 RepID=UPI002731E9B6|nr:DUF4169 family protein [Phenylobacterium sp.]MDP1601622.1 DUF4169 family protein [Phenylobacterium sp.]MDP3594296.1 DUF4169 family protein [Phenylobacterium sp.]